MKGHIRARGKHSWELKFDAGRDPITGERRIQYHSFRGTKREAQVKLSELLAAVGKGEYIEPSKVTVAEHVRTRVNQWVAIGVLGRRSAERYRQLVETAIVPHIGTIVLQKLKPFHIECWHTVLQTGGRRRRAGGLNPRTIRQAHSILDKALREAEKNGLVAKNVCKVQAPPKIIKKESAILSPEQIHIVMERLHGRTLYPMVVTAMFTGLRRGELLALRWTNINLEGAKLRVVEALEQLQDGSMQFKTPKTKAGRREITLPDIVIQTLREHRRQQLQTRLQLGLGRMPDEALVFPVLDGGPRSLRAVSKEWQIFATDIDIGSVTFHGLRHTHASQLIDAGVDLVTISRRLGHSSPTITLGVYAHLFQTSDVKAAAAINAALGGGKSA
jgi:integrase